MSRFTVLAFIGLSLGLSSELRAQDIKPNVPSPELDVDCMTHRFPLNGSGAEVIQNANGIAFGSPINASDHFGRSVAAIHFDGLNDFYEINGNNPIVINKTYSVVAWAKNNPGAGGGPGNQNPIFIQRGDFAAGGGVGDAGVGLFSRIETGYAYWSVREQGGSTVFVQSPAPEDGNWHHYAGVHTTTHLRLYIDGIEVASVPHVFSSDPSLWPGAISYVNIGRHRFSAINFGWFEGNIDDLQVYNCALEPYEILQMATGTPCFIPPVVESSLVSPTSIKLSWSKVPAFDRYQIRARQVGSSTFINRTSGRSEFVMDGLLLGTDYEWQVRANCVTDVSGWTPLRTFSMRDANPNLASESYTTLFPNPADEWLTVKVEENTILQSAWIIAQDGRRVNVEPKSRLNDSEWTFTVDHLESGVYQLQLIDLAGNKRQSKFVVLR